MMAGANPSPQRTNLAVPRTRSRFLRIIYASICTLILSINNSFLGYDMAISGAAFLLIVKDRHKGNPTDIDYWTIEVLIGAGHLFSSIGSIVACKIAHRWGSKRTLFGALVLYTWGTLIMLKGNFFCLFCGRLISSAGAGALAMLCPVYTMDVSPMASVGFLSTIPEVSTNAGMTTGNYVAYKFSRGKDGGSWRIMLLFGVVSALVMGIIVMIFLPESPVWLVKKGRLDDAKTVIWATSDTTEAIQRFTAMKRAFGIPENINSGTIEVEDFSPFTEIWRAVRDGSPLGRMINCCLFINFFHQAYSMDSTVQYVPKVYQIEHYKSPQTPLRISIGIGVVRAITVLLVTPVLRWAERRSLVLFAVAGLVATLTILALLIGIIEWKYGEGLRVIMANMKLIGLDPSSDEIRGITRFFLAMAFGYILMYSLGVGTLPWIYVNEVFPLRVRMECAGISVATNRISSSIASFLFLNACLKLSSTGLSILILDMIVLGSWFYFERYLPETLGRTLEQVRELFRHSSIWKRMKEEYERQTNQSSC